MEDTKYWAFICNHEADVGTYGGAWSKKTHQLRKFETEKELDEFIDAVHNGEMCDYDSSIEIIRTSHDDMEKEESPCDEGYDEYEDTYEDE